MWGVVLGEPHDLHC